MAEPVWLPKDFMWWVFKGPDVSWDTFRKNKRRYMGKAFKK